MRLGNPSPPPLPADRNELEAAQKFLEQAAIENLVSVMLLLGTEGLGGHGDGSPAGIGGAGRGSSSRR